MGRVLSQTDTKVSGASAVIFHEMTRGTIDRYIDDMTTEQLVDLLGHLMIRRRKGLIG